MRKTGTQPQAFTLPDDRVGDITFNGWKVGEASSFADHKIRWFEVSVYITETPKKYIVHTRGMSSNPDERPLHKVVVTDSAYDVIEILTVHHNGKTYIPRASARAIAQAAQHDDNIRDAYINRAVV